MSERNRELDAPLDLLPDLREQMAAEDRSWRRLRSWATPARRTAALVLIFALEPVVLVATPRLDLAAYPIPRLLAALLVLLATATLAIRLFAHPLHVRTPRIARLRSVGAIVLLLPIAFALLPAPHHDVQIHPESFEGIGADFVPRALGCLVFGTLVAIPTLLFLLATNRRPYLNAERIALAASAGGIAGTIALLLHCPLVGVAHRFAGHGGVGLAAVALLAVAMYVRHTRQKISRTV